MKNAFTQVLGPAIVIIALVATAIASVYQAHSLQQFKPQLPSFGLSVCKVTETTVAIGHQAPTTILSGGPRSWALIQQPMNATNTVALSLGGTPAIGSGLELSPATTTSAVPQLAFGYSTPYPYQGAISARTSTGSTSVKVIECK